MLDAEGLRGPVGLGAPIGFRLRPARKPQRFVADLFHQPAYTAVWRFIPCVTFVTALAAIDDQAAVVLRAEEKLRDGAGLRLRKYRLLAPRLSAVRSDEEKRVLR